jgi:hypothetical protein
MPVGTTVADGAKDKKTAIDRKNPIGNWEIHCRGNGSSSGMAVLSAITTLQIGATLAPLPEDQVALNKAAEYLLSALAPQLKLLLQTLTPDHSKPQNEATSR